MEGQREDSEAVTRAENCGLEGGESEAVTRAETCDLQGGGREESEAVD